MRHNNNALIEPRKTKRLYTLTGKIFCGKCGAHFFGSYKMDNRSGIDYSYYQCSTKKSKRTCDAKNIRKDQIETYCMQEIKKHVLNPAAIDEIAAHIVSIAGENPTDLQAERHKHETRKNKLNNIIKKLKRDNLEGEITDEIYREMSHEYINELTEIELKLFQIDAADEIAITPETVKEYLNTMFKNINNIDDEILKVIFDKLIEKIVVFDDRIELYLIVAPYPHVRDKDACGQPHFALSLNITRQNFLNVPRHCKL